MSVTVTESKERITNESTASIVSNNAAPNIDVIWPSSDTLALPNFENEKFLPEIGGNQVSSILSTLDAEPVDKSDQFKSIALGVRPGMLLDQRRLYQEMIFFGCNLCPFICTADSKISDHISSVHRGPAGEGRRARLRCPGCTNVFYHRLSLRAHLMYDHEVGKSDINKIVNGIIYVSSLVNSESEPAEINQLDEEAKKTPTELIEDGPSEVEEEETPSPLPGEKPELAVEEKPPTSVPSASTPTTTSEVHRCTVIGCGARIRDPTIFAYHVLCHGTTDDAKLQCPECGWTTQAWRGMQTHLWRLHDRDTELHACDQCSYRTHSLARLNNVHRPTHGRDRPHLCDACGKSFKNAKQLRNHTSAVHAASATRTRHVCSACGRQFGDARRLRAHAAAVHERLRPHACARCSYRAATRAALRLHSRRHTGERPFRCDSCDYATADHNSLRRHRLRHTGGRSYRCAHCAYACIQSSTYKTHVRTKHPGHPELLVHACDKCAFRTVSRDRLQVHQASHQDASSDSTTT